MRLFIFILYILAYLGCKETITKKPMKYNRHGENLSCNGYYINGELSRVLCFSKNNDTILVENYIDGIRNGKSELRYPIGQIKDIGYLINGSFEGVRQEYYEDGILKRYQFNKIKNDTSFLIYEKEYDKKSKLIALRFPIRFRTDSTNGFKVNDTYQLFVDLKYSEFDSVHSLGYINPAPESSVIADSIIYEGTTLQIQFTPVKEGNHTISGTYIEIDASKSDLTVGYGGHKKWEFKYEAKDY